MQKYTGTICVSAYITVLLYNLLSLVEFDFIGKLTGADLFVACVLPFLNIWSLHKRYPGCLYLIASFAIFLSGNLLADLANQTPYTDILRASAGIVLSAVLLIFWVAIFDRGSDAILFHFAVSAAVNFYRTGMSLDLSELETNINYLKFGPTTYLVPTALIGAHFFFKLFRPAGIVCFVLAGVALILLNARSSGLTLLVAAAILFHPNMLQVKFSRLFQVACIGAFAATLIFVSYAWLILTFNIEGSSLDQFRIMINPYNPVEFLLTGRNHLLIGIQAAWDNPLIGYGSWGRDPTGKYVAMHDEFSVYKFEYPDIIPVHSVLVTMWVWGGIIGAYAAIRLVRFVAITTRYSILGQPGYEALVAMLLPSLLWHLVFSPVGALRGPAAISLAMLCVSVGHHFSYARGEEDLT